MKSRIDPVAVVTPVRSKHDNDALVFRSSLLQSVFDFGVPIGFFGVNFLLLGSRLTKADRARCDSERETQHQIPAIEVHLDLLLSRTERCRLSIRRKALPGRQPRRTRTHRFSSP